MEHNLHYYHCEQIYPIYCRTDEYKISFYPQTINNNYYEINLPLQIIDSLNALHKF